MHGEKDAVAVPCAEAAGELVLTSERFEYMADLLLELQTLAAGAGCETLAGLLSLSHAEARRKADCSKS